MESVLKDLNPILQMLLVMTVFSMLYATKPYVGTSFESFSFAPHCAVKKSNISLYAFLP